MYHFSVCVCLSMCACVCVSVCLKKIYRRIVHRRIVCGVYRRHRRHKAIVCGVFPLSVCVYVSESVVLCFSSCLSLASVSFSMSMYMYMSLYLYICRYLALSMYPPCLCHYSISIYVVSVFCMYLYLCVVCWLCVLMSVYVCVSRCMFVYLLLLCICLRMSCGGVYVLICIVLLKDKTMLSQILWAHKLG